MLVAVGEVDDRDGADQPGDVPDGHADGDVSHAGFVDDVVAFVFEVLADRVTVATLGSRRARALVECDA